MVTKGKKIKKNKIKKLRSTLKPHREKTPNQELKIIFQVLKGKTVVALRCVCAH